MNYQLETAAEGETLAPRAQGNWTPSAVLSAPLGFYDTAVSFTNATDLSADLLGEVVLIDNEVCRVDALDQDAGTLTIARGCADTIPALHAAGARLWWFDDDLTPDQREYASGETVSAVMLTRTSTAMLDEQSAPVSVATVAARQGRPYPPGAVLLNNTPVFSFPAAIEHGDLELSWAHRDRTLELDQLVEHQAADIGPEAGVSYTVRVLVNGAVASEHTGILENFWTYTTKMAAGDGDPATVVLQLVSARDGIESLMPYEVTVNRVATKGYGKNYGASYG